MTNCTPLAALFRVLVLLAIRGRGRGREVAAVVLFALLPSSADALSLYLTTVNGSDTQPGSAVLETAALGVQSYEFWMDIGGIATDPVALDGPLLAFQVVQRTAPGVTVDSFARSGTFPNTITQVSPDGSIFEVIGLAPFICLSGNCPAEGPGPKLLGTLVVDLGVAQDPVLLALCRPSPR